MSGGKFQFEMKNTVFKQKVESLTETKRMLKSMTFCKNVMDYRFPACYQFNSKSWWTNKSFFSVLNPIVFKTLCWIFNKKNMQVQDVYCIKLSEKKNPMQKMSYWISFMTNWDVSITRMCRIITSFSHYSPARWRVLSYIKMKNKRGNEEMLDSLHIAFDLSTSMDVSNDDDVDRKLYRYCMHQRQIKCNPNT